MTKAHKRIAAGIAVGLGAVAALVAWLWPRDASASSSTSTTPARVRDVLNSVFSGSGIPLWFAYANAELESGFGRVPHGDAGRSWGIFHIFWPAHEDALRARGVEDPEELLEPMVCAEYWKDVVGRIAHAVNASADDPPSWDRVRLRLAGRPADAQDADAMRRLGRYWPVAARWREELGR